jgi:hypothetical protein
MKARSQPIADYSRPSARCFGGKKMFGKKMEGVGFGLPQLPALFSCQPFSCHKYRQEKARDLIRGLVIRLLKTCRQ